MKSIELYGWFIDKNEFIDGADSLHTPETGFEPATPSLGGKCSKSRLSYSGIHLKELKDLKKYG